MALKADKRSASDLRDEQWTELEPLLAGGPGAGADAAPRVRELDNWTGIRYSFDKWARDGTWQRVNDRLRECVRVEAGRAAKPSAAIIDRQTVKTTEAGGDRSYVGGKKIRGRLRPLLVDTRGVLLVAAVHTARLQEREAPSWSSPRRPTASPACAGSGPTQPPRANSKRPCGRAMTSHWRSRGARPMPVASSRCRGGGWWSALSPGSIAGAASPRISSGSPSPVRPGFPSPLSIVCSDDLSSIALCVSRMPRLLDS